MHNLNTSRSQRIFWLLAASLNLKRYAAPIQARRTYQRARVVGGPYQLGR